MERRNSESERRAIEAERKRVLDKTHADIRHYLSGGLDPKLKVKDDYLEVLTRDHMGRVKIADDGTITMIGRKAPAKGLPPEEYEGSPSEVLSSWFRSEEAAAWLPAPSPGGTRKEPPKVSPAIVPSVKAPSAQRPTDSLDEAVNRSQSQLADMGIDLARL
jgi:hypothetical protein